jgi:hypothetical protein
MNFSDIDPVAGRQRKKPRKRSGLMHRVGMAGVRPLVPDPTAFGAAGHGQSSENDGRNQKSFPHIISLAP